MLSCVNYCDHVRLGFYVSTENWGSELLVGGKAAADQLGVKFFGLQHCDLAEDGDDQGGEPCSGEAEDPADFKRDIQWLANKKVDAVAFRSSLGTQMEWFTDAFPWVTDYVTVDRHIPGPPHPLLHARVGMSGYELGKVAARALHEAMGGTGKVRIASFFELLAPQVHERAEGARDFLEELGYEVQLDQLAVFRAEDVPLGPGRCTMVHPYREALSNGAGLITTFEFATTLFIHECVINYTEACGCGEDPSPIPPSAARAGLAGYEAIDFDGQNAQIKDDFCTNALDTAFDQPVWKMGEQTILRLFEALVTEPDGSEPHDVKVREFPPPTTRADIDCSGY